MTERTIKNTAFKGGVFLKKSIYSLVLSDSVIRAADQMAYSRGISRSALIDELLAQSLSCVTPEMRMRDIFLSLEGLMENDRIFKIQGRNSESMLSLFSALQYKYRPTIRYSVELYRQFKGDSFGELKIQSRTQSLQLLTALEDFYRLWIELEQAFLGGRNISYRMGDGKLIRQLSLPPGRNSYSETELGEGIAAYIRSFDRAMKIYFESDGDRRLKQELILAVLAEYLRQKPLTV